MATTRHPDSWSSGPKMFWSTAAVSPAAVGDLPRIGSKYPSQCPPQKKAHLADSAVFAILFFLNAQQAACKGSKNSRFFSSEFAVGICASPTIYRSRRESNIQNGLPFGSSFKRPPFGPPLTPILGFFCLKKFGGASKDQNADFRQNEIYVSRDIGTGV